MSFNLQDNEFNARHTFVAGLSIFLLYLLKNQIQMKNRTSHQTQFQQILFTIHSKTINDAVNAEEMKMLREELKSTSETNHDSKRKKLKLSVKIN